ncbi:MAG: glycoside hydrolase family 32 protein [Ferruginibacter sp.]
MKRIFLALLFVSGSMVINGQSAFREKYRPQIHFSPRGNWMNDPNGMVFYKGVYHLFFQYYPDSTVWGPMHWGHATSKDLVHWREQPIALYPDSLGYIFSGSAVVDKNNTSLLGKNGRVPLVAAFTHHNIKMERAGNKNFQYQSLAYSLDDGKSWIKYANNPVLKNPGITDFRDPKIMWYEADRKWIMTLATKDRVTFYTSKNLKDWTKQSEFGESLGAHGGVWECPDLFSIDYKGKTIWVLLVSINPGGPNGGSATQYFTGNFDGQFFKPFQTDTRWLDYGTDNYAGVTWSNTGRRKIFIGWMSNWQYANIVPTQKWRSATTLPRELTIQKIGESYFVSSLPVKELDILNKDTKVITMHAPVKDITLSEGPGKIELSSGKAESFSFTFSNRSGEMVIAGYDQGSNEYYIDRTRSGKTDFESKFAARHTAPRIGNSTGLNMTLITDEASIEMFADNGLTVMTDIFFPATPYGNVQFKCGENFSLKKLAYTSLKSIWRQ